MREPLNDEPLPREVLQDEAEEDYDQRFLAALRDIKARCGAAGIRFEPGSDESMPTVYMPAGRTTRALYINDLDDAEKLLNEPFEEYTFIEEYYAVCSYANGFIAASLATMGPGALSSLRRRIFGLPSASAADDATPVPVEAPSGTQLSARLRLSSHPILELALSGPSLELAGVSVTNQEDAARQLELIGDGLFFELDTRFNIALGFRRVRRTMSRPVVKADELSRKPLRVPLWRYDKQPASLYWYGRSAAGMPLLQFLAYYQALEYYFPIYSQREAIKQTRTILKHPSFSVNDDGDISRLLAAIQTTKSGAYGDERSQLRATVQSCTTADDLRALIAADEKFVRFYTEPKEWKSISEIKIPINNTAADLRTEVSDRIYDIRCKIVHTKGDGGASRSESLLPFSKEAELLAFDIELIRHIARLALMSASVPIQW